MLVPQSVEKTPSATDCRVVVAGVRVGGSAPESATPAAWLGGGGAEGEVDAGGGGSTAGEREFSAGSGMVDSPVLELQVNAWPLCDAV